MRDMSPLLELPPMVPSISHDGFTYTLLDNSLRIGDSSLEMYLENSAVRPSLPGDLIFV